MIASILRHSVHFNNVLYLYQSDCNGYRRRKYGGARGVMVIVVGNGHGDTSSNPGLG